MTTRVLPKVEVDPEYGQVYVYLRPETGDDHVPVYSKVVSDHSPLIVIDFCKCHDELFGVEVVA